MLVYMQPADILKRYAIYESCLMDDTWEEDFRYFSEVNMGVSFEKWAKQHGIDIFINSIHHGFRKRIPVLQVSVNRYDRTIIRKKWSSFQ